MTLIDGTNPATDHLAEKVEGRFTTARQVMAEALDDIGKASLAVCGAVAAGRAMTSAETARLIIAVQHLTAAHGQYQALALLREPTVDQLIADFEQTIGCLTDVEADDPAGFDTDAPVDAGWERVTIDDLVIGDKVRWFGSLAYVDGLGESGEQRAVTVHLKGSVESIDGTYYRTSPVLRKSSDRCTFTEDGVDQAHYVLLPCERHGGRLGR